MKKLLSKRKKVAPTRPALHKPVTDHEREIVHKAVKRTAEEYKETLELLAKT